MREENTIRSVATNEPTISPQPVRSARAHPNPIVRRLFPNVPPERRHYAMTKRTHRVPPKDRHHQATHHPRKHLRSIALRPTAVPRRILLPQYLPRQSAHGGMEDPCRMATLSISNINGRGSSRIRSAGARSEGRRTGLHCFSHIASAAHTAAVSIHKPVIIWLLSYHPAASTHVSR